jgi:hypothetical protein
MVLGVDSVSNRNEYQESSCGVKGGQCIRLTTLPSVSRLSREDVGTSTSHNPMGLHTIYRDIIIDIQEVTHLVFSRKCILEIKANIDKNCVLSIKLSKGQEHSILYFIRNV